MPCPPHASLPRPLCCFLTGTETASTVPRVDERDCRRDGDIPIPTITCWRKGTYASVSAYRRRIGTGQRAGL
jgi:hypothetical protein